MYYYVNLIGLYISLFNLNPLLHGYLLVMDPGICNLKSLFLFLLKVYIIDRLASCVLKHSNNSNTGKLSNSPVTNRTALKTKIEKDKKKSKMVNLLS